MMDYVVIGTYFRDYKKPPKRPADTDILPFADCLAITCREKLDELAGRLEELNKERDGYKYLIDLMVAEKKLDGVSEYFWRQIYAARYLEAIFVQRWMRYWMSILDRMRGGQEAHATGITENEIEHAKECPIETFYPHQLRGTGNRLVGPCPFHDEKTPSFVYYADQNTYHCYGCGANGDAIDYVMRSENLPFRDAVRRLQ